MKKQFLASDDLTLYLLGLVMLATGMALSRFLMSVAQFVLLYAWLTSGFPFFDVFFKQKERFGTKLKSFFCYIGRNVVHHFKDFFHNKLAIVLVSLYLIHVVGVFYSSDLAYAFKDLRVKLPLLWLPIVMSSMPRLKQNQANVLMLFYVASVFVSTAFSFVTYLKHDYVDIREIAFHINHIRVCLNIVLAIFIIGYYLVTIKCRSSVKFLMAFLIAWFVMMLAIFQSLSGMVILLVCLCVTILFLIFTRPMRTSIRVLLLICFMAVPTVTVVYLYRTISELTQVEKVDVSKLDKKTDLGNRYVHDTIHFGVDEGKYIGLYICNKELKKAWSERSEIDYKGKTRNGMPLYPTLLRYLTSKDLRKDAAGVAALSDEDVKRIEDGVANVHYAERPGFKTRLSMVILEFGNYKTHNDPNGGSLSQRLEYTRASLYLIKRHLFFGVGTGDIPQAYQDAYQQLDSPLKTSYRNRAHNQYASITVALGLVGLAVFLFVLFYPYCSARKYRTYLYTVFLTIMLLSMLPEDTIESQAGVTFFAFFDSFFLFAWPLIGVGKSKNAIFEAETKSEKDL